MKKFNQVIKVEVSVDAIAEQLLATINYENPHREMIAETIIGTALEKNTVSFIYNALNGYPADVDFKEGQRVYCTDDYYGYKDGEQKYMERGEATVVEINPYSENKLKIEYLQTKQDGSTVPKTVWVSHLKCNPCNDTTNEFKDIERVNGIKVVGKIKL